MSTKPTAAPRAHLKVAELVKVLPYAMNIGTGKGSSVRDVIVLLCKSFKISNTVIIEPGRVGDPGALVGNVELTRGELGFGAEFDLSASIKFLFIA